MINNSIATICELYDKEKVPSEFEDCIIKGTDINNDYFSSLRSKVHIDLPAVPYMGDVRNAEWYLLMTNPGFEYMEYEENKNELYKMAMLNNLKQTNLDSKYPCVWFNPEFYWTSGFNYWANLLCKSQITLEKLEWLSTHVAIIQMFGYYSSNNKLGFQRQEFSEYNSEATELVKHIQAACPNKKIVISRNRAGWEKILGRETYNKIKSTNIKQSNHGPAPFIPTGLLDAVN
jgi:hypothetical protein